jgi:hypothetical protein
MSKFQIGSFDPNATSTSYTKKKRFDLKTGSNLYRVLPSISFDGSKPLNNPWVFHQLIWLKGKENKYPVVCIRETDKDRKVTVSCPIFDKIEFLKKQLEAMQKNPDTANSPQTKKMAERLKEFNIDKAYYLNVVNKAGEIGILKIRYTALQDLKATIKALNNEGINAVGTGPNDGVFLDFKKIQDDAGRVSYKVDAAKITVKNPQTGRPSLEYDWSPLTTEVINRMETEAADLGKLYRKLELDKLERLASLDPDTIDSVIQEARSVSRDEAADAMDEVDDVEETPAPATTKGKVQTAGTSTDSILNDFLSGGN